MAPEKSHSSYHSVPSPDGALIATVQLGRLSIRSVTTSGILATYKLPNDSVTRCKNIRWSRPGPASERVSQVEEEDWLGTKVDPTRRILLSDDENIRVYDPADPNWKATITSASRTFGTIANVAFGFSPDEVILFSDFGVKLTIWSLVTSRGVEIRDPKYGVACYSYRPKTGHMALLTRGGAQDVMMILKPGSYKVVRSVELGTVDAQEVAWSQDGRWIAVSDAASAGHRILSYTADGQLFKTWTGEGGHRLQLGVKSMRWTREALAVGEYNDNVTFLKMDTFTTLGTFQHLPTISAQGHRNRICWQEQINATKKRTYAEAAQPVNPPTSDSLAKSNTIPRHGISIIAISADGSMLATRSDTWPTTIWVWSLTASGIVAVLIHHSPVKLVEWHPTIDDLLLIHCAVPEPVVHIWKRSWEAPKVLPLSLERAAGRLETTWAQSTSSDVVNIILSSAHQYTNAQISLTDGKIVPNAALAEPEAAAFSMGTGPEDMFDEGHSLDFSPVKVSNGTVDVGGEYDEGFGMTGDSVDDTFHYRRNVKFGG